MKQTLQVSNRMRRGGGRIQLVYLGKEDAFLTGNPKVCFFRVVYRRYTNFAIETVRMYFNGKPDFGQTVTCVIPRFGDLLGECFLKIDLPKVYLTNGEEVGYCNRVGNAIIEEIKIMIGETEIDKHSGMWEDIYNSMKISVDKLSGYDEMVGGISGNYNFSVLGPLSLYVPLSFWFNKNPGQYLPLLSLQYHTIQIRIKLRSLTDLFYTTELYNPNACEKLILQSASISNLELWGDFIYLDINERRNFVSQPQEYLIEQVQVVHPKAINAKTSQISIPLVLNNPIKEIIWVIVRDDLQQKHEYFNYTNVGTNESGYLNDQIASALIQLDGQDRFDAREGGYFRLIQSYQYHTTNTSSRFIYLYSFALRPEELQPSGTLNASRFDSIVLQLNTVDPSTCNGNSSLPRTCYVFAVNYNILKIQDGYGGVMFAT
jgi:hypothetical protein